MTRVRKIALFFYMGVLTSPQRTSVTSYFSAGGYDAVYFRRIPDNYVPKDDIIEDNFSIVSGYVPSTYDRYKTSSTQIVDGNSPAAIYASAVTKPPTSNDTSGNTATSGASVAAPSDAASDA